MLRFRDHVSADIPFRAGKAACFAPCCNKFLPSILQPVGLPGYRCIPVLPASLQAALTTRLGVGSSGNASSGATAALGALAQQQLGSAGQRLQQYIGEVIRARWLIILAGQP